MSKYRKGIFFVVYTKDSNKIEYVILRRKLHWKGWEFPKAGIEHNENFQDALKRELKEETGFKPLKITKFNFSGKYKYDRELKDRPGIIGQTYSLFAIKVKKAKIKIDKLEHTKAIWENYENAIKKLTWQTQKEALKIVNDKIKPKFRELKTDSGNIVLLGKNSQNNEELINHTMPEQEVFHTKARGSPFAVILGKPNKQDIKQAGIFCAKFSQDWKKNKKDVLVHRFKAKDIYKTKLMKTGTFGIKKYKEVLIKKQDIKK
jgi:predicted ribosome quality control (RQC) complex YloA/Tae2 family protein